jgi:acyl carrier protein
MTNVDFNENASTSQETSKAQLISEIGGIIINSVNLHHVKNSDITADTMLTKGGLELDSIDILEVVVAIEQRFAVKVKDAQSGKKYFATVGTVADFVLENRVG